MDTIQVLDWSGIKTPAFKYIDDSLEVSSYSSTAEQGMSLTRADGLVDLESQTINSYNSLYLTSRYKTDEIFTFNQIDSVLETITSAIRYKSGDGFKYLKFEVDGFAFTDVEDTETGRTRFQLAFENQSLIVKHVFNNVEYRLCIEDNNTIWFATTAASTNYNLGYLVNDGGYIMMYRTSTSPYHVVYYDYIVDSLQLQSLSAGSSVIGSDKLAIIDNKYTNLDYDINSSWVSYDKSNLNLSHIDNTRSVFDISGQYLLTTTYDKIQDGVLINFVNLKNNTSEGNIIKRGSIINTGPNNLPDTDFRFYTSLNTGNDQEKGNEDITLTYVFYDKDLYVQPGTDTFFNTSSSLHPYSRLNINDTKFVVNGAHGSFAPSVSDRVKKLRTNSIGYNNGRYLCTWLSGNGSDDARWVDRYYYPDLIEKENAYTATIFDPSFDDPVDDIAYSTAYRSSIDNDPVFDKASDLTLEPNAKYTYQRVSTQDFEDHLISLRDNTVFINRDITRLDGNTSATTSVSDINDTGQFTIAFDAYLIPNKTYGYSILGNLTNFGFSVLNDTFITPVLFTMQGKTIYYYNTQQSLIATQMFDKDVKDIIRFGGLDNYLVICEDGYVYNLKYNNAVTRMKIVPQLSSYIAFTNYENTVAFLLDEGGDCLLVDSLSLEVSYDTAINTTTSTIASIFYDGILKGIPGSDAKLYDADHVCYLIDSTIYKQHTSTGDIEPVIQSATSISDYSVDTDGNYLLIHNSNMLSMYNKNRIKVFAQSLSSIPLSGNKCDFLREQAGDVYNSMCVAGIDDAGNTKIATYDYDGILQSSSTVSGNLSATQSSISNYNYNINSDNSNTLQFKLRLQNLKDRTDIYTDTITYNYKDISEGFVSFSYTFDSVKGVITLLANGIPYKTSTFEPAKYSLTEILNDDIQIGATGFYNGQALHDFIGLRHYIAYDTILRNIFIFNKPLLPGESAAISLLESEIDDLNISIPCSQRSNIEEVLRFFKFGSPSSSSNRINIQIKNSGIVDADFQDAIVSSTRNVLERYTKGDVLIGDISFIDYTPPA